MKTPAKLAEKTPTASDVDPVVKCHVCRGHGYRFDRSQCEVCAGSGKLTAPKEVHEMKFRKFDKKSIFHKEGT